MYGTCHAQRHTKTVARPPERPAVARPADERVTNADREATGSLLRRAFADGVLRVEEFDERLSLTYSATTVADLDAVTADLPGQWLDDVRTAEKAEQKAATHRRYWRAELSSYMGVMALLVAIWGLTSLASGDVIHPWPIWPALGWGVPLYLSRPRGQIARAVHRRLAAR